MEDTNLDCISYLLGYADSVMGDWLFSYDAMDRLTAAAAGGSAPSAFRGQSGGWSYDSYGNRTAQSFTNSVNSSWATYNPANNRISTASSAMGGYVYDASGNTLYDGNNEYWYDAEGQLCAVAPTNSYGYPTAPYTGYIYDGEGARIGKGTLSAPPAPYTPISANLASSPTCAPPFSSGFTLTTRYLVDQANNQVTELSEQSGEVWKHSNVFSAARLTATYDASGLHYALADPLGTKRVQANISGQIEMSWVSLPFGDALTPIAPPNPPSTADDATEHHFTGKERDTESGNDYFGARYYSSSMGRFMSPDWSAKEEPVPYAKLGNPQTLNLYSYVLNNPLSNVDPDGHLGCGFLWLSNCPALPPPPPPPPPTNVPGATPPPPAPKPNPTPTPNPNPQPVPPVAGTAPMGSPQWVANQAPTKYPGPPTPPPAVTPVPSPPVVPPPVPPGDLPPLGPNATMGEKLSRAAALVMQLPNGSSIVVCITCNIEAGWQRYMQQVNNPPED